MNMLNKKTLQHLVELSRIKIDGRKEEKFLEDFGKIIGYFEELKKVDTEQVEPMSGGAELVNVSRKDESDDELIGRGKAGFPEEQKGFLRIPGVFE